MQFTTVGIDLAKSVFQVHCLDTAGGVTRKKLRRSEVLRFFAALDPCLVGMESCATAHYWAREIEELGHEVRLMPPAYVKAYLRRQKNDAADAEAICEAVSRPTMRFVPIKSAERQGVLVLHRTRELLVRQRTKLINAIRGHCAEFGLVAPQGPRRVVELLDQVRAGAVASLPEIAGAALLIMGDQLTGLAVQIHALEQRLVAWHRQNQASQRLATIPGVGIMALRAAEHLARKAAMGLGWARTRFVSAGVSRSRIACWSGNEGSTNTIPTTLLGSRSASSRLSSPPREWPTRT